MLTCNINARGKAVRLVLGVVFALTGLVLLTLSFMGIVTGRWGWALATALLLAGGFMIFEGAAGWCVLRAMGLRTFI